MTAGSGRYLFEQILGGQLCGLRTTVQASFSLPQRTTTMPIATDDHRLDQARFLALYARLASIQLGTLANQYDYASIKRLIAVDGDDIAADSDDPLSDRIVDGILALPRTERDGKGELNIEPAASLAALFQAHELARALKPRLYVGFDLHGDAQVCGILTTCIFERDDALSTSRLTQSYCNNNKLPRIDDTWTLVDVVASAKQGTGALLLLSAIVAAIRAKKTGMVSVAVTRGGRRLFQSFGFDASHSWKERGGQRYLCYVRLKDIHLADLHKRLRIHDALLTDVCFRNGLTSRSMNNLVGRR